MDCTLAGAYYARPAHAHDASADAAAKWSEYVSAHGGVTTSKEAKRLHRVAKEIQNRMYPNYIIEPENVAVSPFAPVVRKRFRRSAPRVSRPCCNRACTIIVSRIESQMVGKNVFCSAACHNAFCSARNATRPVVTLPCDCRGCVNTSTRLVSDVAPGKKYYCSTKCQYEGRKQCNAAAKLAN